MARKLVVQITDDYDGGIVSDGNVESVSFGLDGVNYRIELRPDNAEKLRHDLGKWIHAAQRADDGQDRRLRRVSVECGTRSREELNIIREWAVGQGYRVAARGRIPVRILTAFADAHLVTGGGEHEDDLARQREAG
ncbi:histone-like nucleoid-structuring protein Lsr2 [Nocardia pseudovaccinii]|uniref:histone-like nucleoid-structuring protein Lsr2 n=1 Tax=Nocardia pseudovaccinii TaxID=189540 RepID=UPI003D927FB9